MIRLMNNSDAEINEIMNIWLESTIKAHFFISKEYWEKNYDLVKEIYIPQSESYVYIDDERILGFISILNQNFIGAIFVNVDQQGRGIGRKLIEYSKLKYDNLSLAVYKENIQAVKFYKKMGFEFVKEQLNEDTRKAEYIMNFNKNYL